MSAVRTLKLEASQLEDIRASLVQRRCRITELLQLASETPAQPTLMACLEADRNRISDLLLLVAKA